MSTPNSSGLPPLPPYDPNTCDNRFAQGSVAALLAAIAPEFAKYLDEMNKSQVGMITAGLKAAESQANSALASGIVQGGVSLVGAVADGAGVYSSVSQIATEKSLYNTFATTKSQLEEKIAAVDKNVASLQIKPETNPANKLNNTKKITLTEESEWKPMNEHPFDTRYKNARTNEIKEAKDLPRNVKVQLEEEKANNASLDVDKKAKPQTKEDLEAQKAKYQSDIDAAEKKYKSDSKVNEYNSRKTQSISQGLNQMANLAGQPLKGIADKNAAIQQQAASMANSSAGQAQGAKDDSNKTFDAIINQRDLMGYGQSMVRG